MDGLDELSRPGAAIESADMFDKVAAVDTEQLSAIEQEALDRKIRQGKGHEFVIKTITNCSKTGSVYLDLSNRYIHTIPPELLTLTHIQYLYLEGNQLEKLPEDFFQKLSNLKWLDLRNNSLLSIPSAYIGSHGHLTHLLLQGNRLQTLPLELGLVSSLTALNIALNPLKFPPKSVIEQGVVEILAYLKQVLLSKSNGTYRYGGDDNSSASNPTSDDPPHLTDVSDSSDLSGARVMSEPSDGSEAELKGKPVSLQRQVSYKELRKDKMERIQRAGASGRIDSSKKTSATARRQADVSLYPEPPSADLIDTKVRERQLQAITREKNAKIDAILQRRKDEERLRKFRDEAKVLQRQKEYEKYMSGGTLDYVEPASQAPFDVLDSDMRVMTNEERIKMGVKEQHERIRRVLSPRAIKQMELEKVAKENELKKKIKDHADSMKQRRKKPKGSAQDEMQAALKELEIAKRLQHELDRRKRNLDYRFKAYNPPP